MLSLARLFFLVLISTFFLLPGSTAALSGEANAMCKPYIAECPCNQVLNKWRFMPGQPKCKAGGEKNGAGYSNTHACKVGVCKDVTNEHVTQGVCIAAGKCEGKYADDEPVKKTDVPVKDGDKPVTAEPPPPPSVSDTGDVTGGMPQKPEVPETTVQDPTKDLQETPDTETPVPSDSAKSVEDQLKEAAGEPSLWERWFGGETTPKPETPAQPDAPVGLDGQPVQTLQPDAVADPQLSDTGVVQPQQGEPTHTFGQPEETKTAPAEDATWWGAVKGTAADVWEGAKDIAANVRDTVADAFTSDTPSTLSIGEIEMPPPPAEVPTFADTTPGGTPEPVPAGASAEPAATQLNTPGNVGPVPYAEELSKLGFGNDLLGGRLKELNGLIQNGNDRIEAGNADLAARKESLDAQYAQLQSACAARTCTQSQIDTYKERAAAYDLDAATHKKLAEQTREYVDSAKAIASVLNKPTDLSAYTGSVPDTPENKFVSDVSRAALGEISRQELNAFWNNAPASDLVAERSRIAGNAFEAATHNVTPSQVADAFGDSARLSDIRNQTAITAAQEQLRQIESIRSDTPISQLTPEQADLLYREPLIREELTRLESESQSRAERTENIQHALRNSQYGEQLARALTTEPKTPAERFIQEQLYTRAADLSRNNFSAELLRNTEQAPTGLTPEDYYIPVDTGKNVYTDGAAQADRYIGELTGALKPSPETQSLLDRVNGNESFGRYVPRALADATNYVADLPAKGLEALGVNSTVAHVANGILNPVKWGAAAYDAYLTLSGNPSTERMLSEFGMSSGERTFARAMDYASIAGAVAPARALAGMGARSEIGAGTESARAFTLSDSVATNAARVELPARDFGAGAYKHVGDTPLGPVYAADTLPSVASRVTNTERQAIEALSGRSLTTADRTILSQAGLEARPYGTVQAEISRGTGVAQITESVNIQRTALVNANGEVVAVQSRVLGSGAANFDAMERFAVVATPENTGVFATLRQQFDNWFGRSEPTPSARPTTADATPSSAADTTPSARPADTPALLESPRGTSPSRTADAPDGAVPTTPRVTATDGQIGEIGRPRNLPDAPSAPRTGDVTPANTSDVPVVQTPEAPLVPDTAPGVVPAEPLAASLPTSAWSAGDSLARFAKASVVAFGLLHNPVSPLVDTAVARGVSGVPGTVSVKACLSDWTCLTPETGLASRYELNNAGSNGGSRTASGYQPRANDMLIASQTYPFGTFGKLCVSKESCVNVFVADSGNFNQAKYRYTKFDLTPQVYNTIGPTAAQGRTTMTFTPYGIAKVTDAAAITRAMNAGTAYPDAVAQIKNQVIAYAPGKNVEPTAIAQVVPPAPIRVADAAPAPTSPTTRAIEPRKVDPRTVLPAELDTSLWTTKRIVDTVRFPNVEIAAAELVNPSKEINALSSALVADGVIPRGSIVSANADGTANVRIPSGEVQVLKVVVPEAPANLNITSPRVSVGELRNVYAQTKSPDIGRVLRAIDERGFNTVPDRAFLNNDTLKQLVGVLRDYDRMFPGQVPIINELSDTIGRPFSSTHTFGQAIDFRAREWSPQVKALQNILLSHGMTTPYSLFHGTGPHLHADGGEVKAADTSNLSISYKTAPQYALHDAEGAQIGQKFALGGPKAVPAPAPAQVASVPFPKPAPVRSIEKPAVVASADAPAAPSTNPVVGSFDAPGQIRPEPVFTADNVPAEWKQSPVTVAEAKPPVREAPAALPTESPARPVVAEVPAQVRTPETAPTRVATVENPSPRTRDVAVGPSKDELQAQLNATNKEIADAKKEIAGLQNRVAPLKAKITTAQTIPAAKTNLSTAARGLNLMKSLWSKPDKAQERILVAGTNAAAQLGKQAGQLGNAQLAGKIQKYVSTLHSLSRPENQTLSMVNNATAQGDALIADATTFLANAEKNLGTAGKLTTLQAEERELAADIASHNKKLAALQSTEKQLTSSLKEADSQRIAASEPASPTDQVPSTVQPDTTVADANKPVAQEVAAVEPEADVKTPEETVAEIISLPEPKTAVDATVEKLGGGWTPQSKPAMVADAESAPSAISKRATRGPSVAETAPAVKIPEVAPAKVAAVEVPPAKSVQVRPESAVPTPPALSYVPRVIQYGTGPIAYAPPANIPTLQARMNVAIRPREPEIQAGSGGQVLPTPRLEPLPPVPSAEAAALAREQALRDPIVATDDFANFPRQKLEGENAQLQEAAIAKYISNKEQLLDTYEAHFGTKVVNPDLARLLFRDMGYSGVNSAAVQKVVADMTDELWKRALANNPEDYVVLYTGSAGAGKSSSINNVLPEMEARAAVIMDGTLSNKALAEQRIAEALAAGKQVEVINVYRDPIDAWNNGVIARMKDAQSIDAGRVVPISVFVLGYKRSMEVVNSLLTNPREGVHVSLIENVIPGSPSAMSPERFQTIRYSSSVERTIRNNTSDLLERGVITPRQYEAITGAEAPGKLALVADEPVVPVDREIPSLIEPVVSAPENPVAALWTGDGVEERLAWVLGLPDRVAASLQGTADKILDLIPAPPEQTYLPPVVTQAEAESLARIEAALLDVETQFPREVPDDVLATLERELQQQVAGLRPSEIDAIAQKSLWQRAKEFFSPSRESTGVAVREPEQLQLPLNEPVQPGRSPVAAAPEQVPVSRQGELFPDEQLELLFPTTGDYVQANLPLDEPLQPTRVPDVPIQRELPLESPLTETQLELPLTQRQPGLLERIRNRLVGTSKPTVPESVSGTNYRYNPVTDRLEPVAVSPSPASAPTAVAIVESRSLTVGSTEAFGGAAPAASGRTLAGKFGTASWGTAKFLCGGWRRAAFCGAVGTGVYLTASGSSDQTSPASPGAGSQPGTVKPTTAGTQTPSAPSAPGTTPPGSVTSPATTPAPAPTPTPTPIPTPTPAPTPATPTTAPKPGTQQDPSPMSVPAPVPLPKPRPGGAPAPVPTPQPQPQPAPVPSPAPSPSPEQPTRSGSGGSASGIGSLLGSLMNYLGLGNNSQPKPAQQPTTPTRSPTSTSTPTTIKPIVSLVPNPARVKAGSTATLWWASIGTTECSVSDSGGTVLVKGSSTGKATTAAIQATSKFIVTCKVRSGGDIRAETTVSLAE